MLYVFKAKAPLFQTAWFVESLFTQTLVIFVIRTRTVPFFNSKPNKWLTINIAVILGLALILPFTAVRQNFQFRTAAMDIFTGTGWIYRCLPIPGRNDENLVLQTQH